MQEEGQRDHKKADVPEEDEQTVYNDNFSPSELIFNRSQHSFEGNTLINGESPVKFHHELKPSVMSRNIQQLQYNKNKITLDRCIAATTELVAEFQHENSQNLINYPKLNSNLHKKSVLPAEELQIININLKIDHLKVSEVNNSTLQALLNEKLNLISKHLSSIKQRVNNNTSKILVTGDLNSGKSTFCNKLLKKKLLPEDQQPCTTVFCEVIDYKQNNEIEQVHAVLIDHEYQLTDQSTYEVFKLSELNSLVGQYEKYSILKIFIKDDQDFLNNGVINISLIDAPGLNMDSYHTTKVFSTQEEIDLVIFVVNSENHFTQSGKEFISTAANDKNLIFIVVNKFDQIHDKNRCKEGVLSQVEKLSPESYKDSDQFVHFVSSKQSDPKSGGGDGGSPDAGDDDNNDQAFNHLEENLKNFIFKKRSLSKLQPAKTYLLNLLQDLIIISNLNVEIYQQELDELNDKFDNLNPRYEQQLIENVKINEKLEKLITETCDDVYNHTVSAITNSIKEVEIEYPGIAQIFEYAITLEDQLTQQITNSVIESENYARQVTTDAVAEVNSLSKKYLPNDVEKVFNNELMFSRRFDSLQKNFNESITLIDFFNPSIENFLQFYNLKSFKIFNWKNWIYSASIYTISKLSPSTLLNLSFSLQYNVVLPIVGIIGAGLFGVYCIYDVPNALNYNLKNKISRQLVESNYKHLNADRISKEVRKVLSIPCKELIIGCQKIIDTQIIEKNELLNRIDVVGASCGKFEKFVEQAELQRNVVNSVEFLLEIE